MKKLLPLVLTFSGITFASTPINGLYLKGFGGAAILPGNIDRTTNYGYYFNNSQYYTGFNAGGALGYQTDSWHFEAEIDFIKANIKQIYFNGSKITDLEGYSQALLGFVNAYYDIPFDIANTILPFIGGGIGYGFLQNNYQIINEVQESIHNASFAYHGSAGLQFHLSRTLDIAGYYRYLSTTHVNTLGSRFQANLINASITYRFDACELK